MTLFEEFNRVGVSMLIASHDLALIARLRHRILTLDHGHIHDPEGAEMEPAES
jgi:cell division transport system ATP-binding protein